MKKYHDIETNEILTTTDLEAEFIRLKAEHETEAENFADYLSNCLEGTLEEIAPDYMIDNLRRNVAKTIATRETSYEEILEKLNNYGFFGNWTIWEINHRPVDVDEIEDIIFG